MSQIKVRRDIRFLPALGAASLTLAHLQTAAAFRRKTREIFSRLENTSAPEPEAAPIPAVMQAFASRAVGRNPAPRVVWLHQTGEMRSAPDSPWRPFTAEQMISVSRPGFAWLARMQAMPLLSARILDCYIDGEGLLEARLGGSLPLARAAGQEFSRAELMRYLAELIWAPHAMRATLRHRHSSRECGPKEASPACGRARQSPVYGCLSPARQ